MAATSRASSPPPLDKLKPAVKQRVQELLDQDLQNDDLLISFLSELQTRQALKVLEVYAASMQRQTNKIKSPAGYMMRLIQTAKHGSGTHGSGDTDKLVGVLAPRVRKLMTETFDPVEDRAVFEDRPLMGLLAKLPERQTMAALEKYRSTLMLRGRASIQNPCGYLIHQLKQVSQAESLSGSGTMSAPSVASSAATPASEEMCSISSLTTPTSTGMGGSVSAAAAASAHWDPIKELKPAVRDEWFKAFDPEEDKGVYEDVGLIKQLGRLDEQKGVEALRTYQQARAHNGRPFERPPAYLMGILRNYINGVKPLPVKPQQQQQQQQQPVDPSAALKAKKKRVRIPGSPGDLLPSQDAIFLDDPETSMLAPHGMPQHLHFEPAVDNGMDSLSLEQRMGRLSFGSSGMGGLAMDAVQPSSAGPASDSLLPPGLQGGMGGQLGAIGQRSMFDMSAPPRAKVSPERANGVQAHSQGSAQLRSYGAVGQPIKRPQPPQQQQQPAISDTLFDHQSSMGQHTASSLDLGEEEAGARSGSGSSSSTCAEEANATDSAAATAAASASSSAAEVCNILNFLGLSKHVDALMNAEIDMSALHLLKEDDLKEIGLPKGPRVKLLHYLQQHEAPQSAGVPAPTPRSMAQEQSVAAWQSNAPPYH
jgi:hypothetical protein